MKENEQASVHSNEANVHPSLMKSILLRGAPESGSSRRNLLYGALAAIAVIVLALLPLYMDTDSYFVYYLFIVFIYLIIAQGWNLVAGYAGQVSLGANAFVGLGAYTVGIIWLRDVTHTGYFFDPLVMLLAGIVPAVFAFIIGLPLLSRLRGDYFSFGTLGAGQILFVIALKLKSFTGGADGLKLPSKVYTSMHIYYWVALGLAVAATLLVFFIMRSRWGLALKAIREDETSAASHGVHVLKYKVIAFCISAFLAGLAGTLYAYYFFLVNPDLVMTFNFIIYPILMVVLGGTGTILGPVLGAFFAGALLVYGPIYLKSTHPILTGILIILVMKFMPAGLIGLGSRFSRR